MLLIGPKSRPFLFQPAGGLSAAALRLKLEWVEPLLGLLPAEHRDSQPDLASVLPGFTAVGAPSAGRHVDTGSGPRKSWQTRCNGGWAPSPAIGPAWKGQALDLLRASNGKTSVDTVAGIRIGSVGPPSPPHRAVPGRSLAQGLRSGRCASSAAVADADRAVVPQWARIAADTGFCDQSHLVRESRALCGMAPAAVDRERRAEAEMSNRRRAS